MRWQRATEGRNAAELVLPIDAATARQHAGQAADFERQYAAMRGRSVQAG